MTKKIIHIKFIQDHLSCGISSVNAKPKTGKLQGADSKLVYICYLHYIYNI